MPESAAGYPGPGEMLGPYRVVRRLGFGGMGVVLEAVDGTLNRPVALKVISPHLAEDPAFRARFVREARAQASVRSPHVVAVHSHGEQDGRLYIATELVDGGDLGRWVHEHGAPPMATALDIIAQVASGLADAHASGLVHRDLKPANVLLRHREHGIQAYLADFGIAHQVGAPTGVTHAGGTVGTPSYMAPELHTGTRAGVASDLYSLGCLLWAVVTGMPPYAGGSDYQVARAHLEQAVPQLRSGTPAADAVNRVLLRAMAKRPADRYPDASAMSRDLREAAALGEQAGETAARATLTRRRGLVACAVTVAVLLAAGVAGAIALLGSDVPSGPGSSAPPASRSPTVPTGDRAAAVASLAQALRSQQVIPERIATCVAEGWVDGVGLPAMMAAGFLDDEMGYVDQPQESLTPQMRGVLTRVVSACSPDASS